MRSGKKVTELTSHIDAFALCPSGVSASPVTRTTAAEEMRIAPAQSHHRAAPAPAGLEVVVQLAIGRPQPVERAGDEIPWA
jgi:hypothetical protein